MAVVLLVAQLGLGLTARGVSERRLAALERCGAGTSGPCLVEKRGTYEPPRGRNRQGVFIADGSNGGREEFRPPNRVGEGGVTGPGRTDVIGLHLDGDLVGIRAPDGPAQWDPTGHWPALLVVSSGLLLLGFATTVVLLFRLLAGTPGKDHDRRR